jgi:hypothetical protein
MKTVALSRHTVHTPDFGKKKSNRLECIDVLCPDVTLLVELSQKIETQKVKTAVTNRWEFLAVSGSTDDNTTIHLHIP